MQEDFSAPLARAAPPVPLMHAIWESFSTAPFQARHSNSPKRFFFPFFAFLGLLFFTPTSQNLSLAFCYGNSRSSWANAQTNANRSGTSATPLAACNPTQRLETRTGAVSSEREAVPLTHLSLHNDSSPPSHSSNLCQYLGSCDANLLSPPPRTTDRTWSARFTAPTTIWNVLPQSKTATETPLVVTEA